MQNRGKRPRLPTSKRAAFPTPLSYRLLNHLDTWKGGGRRSSWMRDVAKITALGLAPRPCGQSFSHAIEPSTTECLRRPSLAMASRQEAYHEPCGLFRLHSRLSTSLQHACHCTYMGGGAQDNNLCE